MLDERELDLWIKNDLNVLFEGKHGVGKTAMITAAFDKHGLNWKYFSAATMDPWVDFVGVPKDGIDDDGLPVLDLIRPRGFHNGTVEAIFMDELNRAPKKVRNAVMELIQFKSINGVKFPNLRFIWAAINPDDEDADVKYDVDALDPAQKDRFHICIEIPYKPSPKYFKDMYGTAGEGAVEWWNSLSVAHRELVSPRRLEYAVKVWQMGGSIRHVLRSKQLNASKLLTMLEAGSLKKKLRGLLSASDDKVQQAFSNMNFCTDSLPIILKSPKQIKKFAEFLPKDIVSDIITKTDKGSKANKGTREFLVHAPTSVIEPIIKSIVGSGTLTKRKLKTLGDYIGYDLTKYLPVAVPSTRPTAATFTEVLIEYYKKTNICGENSTHQRIEALTDVFNSVEAELEPRRQALIALMMFLSAVIGRTQQATLDRGGHSIPALSTEIMLILTSKAKAINEWPADIWKLVKREITSVGRKKQYVKGKGAGKIFTQKEIDKIENFLFNSPGYLHKLIGLPPPSGKVGVSKRGIKKLPKQKSANSGWTLDAMKKIVETHKEDYDDDDYDDYDDDDIDF